MACIIDARRRQVTADADGLFGEPSEELGSIGDLTSGLGERLAHFCRHDEGELVLARDDHVVGAA